MKYDRIKKWDAQRKVTAQRTFQQGYKAGYNQHTIAKQCLKQNPKDPYIIGFLKGRLALKKDKMKELVSGKPRKRFPYDDEKYIGYDDFMDSTRFYKMGVTNSGMATECNLETAAKAIADMIDEDLIKND